MLYLFLLSFLNHKIIAGPENANTLKLNEKVDIKRIRYFYMQQSGELVCSPVTSDLQEAMKKVVKHFAKIADKIPHTAILAGTDQSFQLWRYWITKESLDNSLVLGNGVRLNGFTEFVKKLCGQSDFTMATILSILKRKQFSAETANEMEELKRHLDQELTVSLICCNY